MLLNKKLCQIYAENFICLIKFICASWGQFFWIFGRGQIVEDLTLSSVHGLQLRLKIFYMLLIVAAAPFTEFRALHSGSNVLQLTICTPSYASRKCQWLILPHCCSENSYLIVSTMGTPQSLSSLLSRIQGRACPSCCQAAYLHAYKNKKKYKYFSNFLKYEMLFLSDPISIQNPVKLEVSCKYGCSTAQQHWSQLHFCHNWAAVLQNSSHIFHWDCTLILLFYISGSYFCSAWSETPFFIAFPDWVNMYSVPWHCSLGLGCFQLINYYSHAAVFTTGGRGCASDCWPEWTSILSPRFWISIWTRLLEPGQVNLPCQSEFVLGKSSCHLLISILKCLWAEGCIQRII